tara:strand:- start:4102 stop:4350 length:249 start_codon:yes stop_codon:yes gene_type:complete
MIDTTIFNQEKECALADSTGFLDSSDSYLLLTKNGEQIRVSGYSSAEDQLQMLMNYLASNKKIGKVIETYFKTNEENALWQA